MQERRRCAARRRGSRESAGEIGDLLTMQKDALTGVLGMNQRICAADTGAERLGGSYSLMRPTEAVTRAFEIGFAELPPALPVLSEREVGGIGTVAAWRPSEHARETRVASSRRRQRIVGIV